jgi:hypothetical protein
MRQVGSNIACNDHPPAAEFDLDPAGGALAGICFISVPFILRIGDHDRHESGLFHRGNG